MRDVLWKKQYNCCFLKPHKLLVNSRQNTQVSSKWKIFSKVCVIKNGSNILVCFSFSYRLFVENAAQEKEEVVDKVLR